MKTSILAFIFKALFIYILMSLIIFLIAPLMIFLPPKPSTYQAQPDIFQLKTKDNQHIAAYFLPPKAGQYVILYSHGNAIDLGPLIAFLKLYHAEGYGVLGYDYRGYGLSDGHTSEHRTYLDIQAAYDFLVKEKKIAPERILLLGQSVGSGPTLDLASRHPVGGVILESPFLSAFRVVTWVPIFPVDRYVNTDKVQSIHCPLLIIHGQQDDVIPHWHGFRLYKMALFPKYFISVENAGHNDLLARLGPKYWYYLKEFTARLRASLPLADNELDP